MNVRNVLARICSTAMSQTMAVFDLEADLEVDLTSALVQRSVPTTGLLTTDSCLC